MMLYLKNIGIILLNNPLPVCIALNNDRRNFSPKTSVSSGGPVLVCTDLQDVPAVPDALLGPEADDPLGAGASRAVIQPAEDLLTHRGCQQGGRGGAGQALLQRQLRLHGRPETRVGVSLHSGLRGEGVHECVCDETKAGMSFTAQICCL